MAINKSNKKILITGGSGMVGSMIEFGIKPSHKEFNILNIKSIEQTIKKYGPHVILHLAAFTNMLEAEKYPERAYRTNVIGTYNLAHICRKKNIWLVYISTCAVFNGNKKSPYTESDKPNPINIYGKTKWLGEIIVQDLIENALIIRTGWLFGSKAKDKKFVKLAFEKCLQKKPIQATSDRQGSPTYIPDLLTEIKRLITTNTSGIVHVVNSGQVSYFEIAKMIKQIVDCRIAIKPVKAKNIESPFLKRGAMEALTSEKVFLRPWQEALQEYIHLLLAQTK